MKKHLKIILKKMCRMVGADFNKIDFQEENWYWLYSWKKGQQEKFIKWLADYLYKDNEALKEIAHLPIRTKVFCLRVAQSFESNYGWRTVKA